MITTHWMQSAAAAKSYYRQSDYYASVPGDWLGHGAKMLGLTGPANAADFDRLADNLHPLTGEPLTTYTRDGRRVGLDMTFNSTKSVGIARELAGAGNDGDPRVEQAHREAVAYTIGMVEADMQGRVRIGGVSENRNTGNLVAYRVTHRDTRINADDGHPDMSLHDHVFIFNATYDAVEGKWKAAEIGQIKHDAPYYEAAYHNRLASNLKAIGYGVERKGKAFEVAGVSEELVRKFSRRSAYIDMVADKLGIVKPESKAKLGATTRLGKAKELANDLTRYYVSRLTEPEKRQLASLQGRASSVSSVEGAVGYAIGHMFERKSVVDEKRLYETALRHGIGSVTPEGVQAEAIRQGALLKAGEATTRAVLAEEARVIGFARDGRGTCRPMGSPGRGDPGHGPLSPRVGDTVQLRALGSGLAGAAPATQSPLPKRDTATPPADRQAISASQGNQPVSSSIDSTFNPIDDILKQSLSAEQAAIARHVWNSPDRVILIRGAAGTGKTHTMKATIAGIDRPVVVLAPSADASRGVLRKEGFADADTVSCFLLDEKFQQKAKGGVIWVDEAGLLGIRQVRQVFDKAEELGARVVLQGDKRQHGSVERGATLRVLEQYAGLPVAQLRDIRRQRGKYKQAVNSLAEGKMLDGYDALQDLGWVKPVADNTPLVDDYLAAVSSGKEVLAIAPTHVEADEVTAAIRDRLKAGGVITGEEHAVSTLVPLHWTDAERGDLERYEGTEVVQFHRNGGTFKAGDRVAISAFKAGDKLGPASTFAVYGPSSVSLAKGDRIRITANGWTADKKHRLDNGAQYTVAGFEKDGKLRLTNGWFLAPDFKHLAHGYVTTSHASQGKTVDRVLIAMGQESLPAITAEQFYVSVSRGREQATVYTDVAPDVLREAVQRADGRKSATELMRPPPPQMKPSLLHAIVQRSRAAWQALRSRNAAAMPEMTKQREYSHGR